MKIAILGFGTIGKGVYDLIQKQPQIEVAGIYVRASRPVTLPEMTSEYADILNNDDIALIVECMGGVHPAYEMILQAFKHHKHVISANKKVIAHKQKELHLCALQNKVQFLYEASCGGGIPFLHEIERITRMEHILEIRGIFNGTCNYILDLLQQPNTALTFKEALTQAQLLGYAEKDPSDDIDGYDTAYKLQISAGLAFQTWIEPDFSIAGIRHLNDKDLDYFSSHNLCLKLYAQAVTNKHRYACIVEPVLFSNQHLLAHIPTNYNACTCVSESLKDLTCVGQGAGKYPTAHAIIQNILDIPSRAMPQKRLDFTYDPSLLKGTYIIRASRKWHTYLAKIVQNEVHYPHGTFYTTKRLPTSLIYDYFQSIQQQEPNSFIARIWEE